MAQSFSKNFGLYGERIGALHVVTRNRNTAAKVEAILKKMQRAEISTPPSFGAKIIATIIEKPELLQQWHRDLETMSNRMKEMRRRLYDELIKRQTPGNWGHLLTDVGVHNSLRTIDHDIAN